MKHSALALAVVGAFGLVPDALSHELAFSKKDKVMVEVPGTADTWCKPDIELTISRPTWDNQQTLDRLVSVLPVVLGKDCPAARVTWKAVDASGKQYASGFGDAANLGIVSLTQSQLRQDGPTANPSSASPTVEPVAAAGTQTPASTAGSTAEVSLPKPEATTQTVATEPVPARAQDEPASATGSAIPAAVVEAVATDGGRSVVLSNTQLAQVEDGVGCKWVVGKNLLAQGAESLSITSTPAMPCPTSGFSEGEYDKVTWKIQNTYRGDSWANIYVHPSGLMFSKAKEEAVKGKGVSFVSPDAAQALFLLGELPARQMKVYLAFARSNYQVPGPFTSGPSYVVTTPDESFALDPVQYRQAALEVFQLVEATSPTTVSLANFQVARNLDALYPATGWRDEQQLIVRNEMGETRGQFHFDALTGMNWAAGREKERALEARRQMERMANLHTRVLARYEQLKSSLKDASGHESEALAQLAGIRARFSSPLAMMDPGSSMRASPMMVHVTGHEGDYYLIDFPGPGRLQSDRKLGNEWYVLQAANLTPVAPLVDGKAVPTFKIYSAEEPEPCKQASCAERVSFGAVLGREFPDAGIDFSWTPEVSQQHLNAWKNASAQIQ